MPTFFSLYKKLPSFLKWSLPILALFLVYLLWSRTGRNNIQQHTPLQIREISEVGAENFKANIVCIQPFMLSEDYASLEAFYSKMDGYFSKAQEEGLLQKNTLVVFPEHLGTPLYFIDEKSSVIKANSMKKSGILAVSSNLWRYLRYAFKLSDLNFSKVFLQLKAEQVSNIYHFVFASMAKKYQVMVLPGSIILPCPSVNNGILGSKAGEPQNISLIYQPNGRAFSKIITEKNINSFENTLIDKDKSREEHTFATPLGNVAIKIGEDIWWKGKEKQDITINPYSSTTNLEAKSSKHFNNLQLKLGCNTDLTLESCFLENLSKPVEKGTTLALSLFMRGKLWDRTYKGKTIINYQNQIITGFDIEGASIISIGIP